MFSDYVIFIQPRTAKDMMDLQEGNDYLYDIFSNYQSVLAYSDML